MMYPSEMFGGMGSEAISAVPVLAKMRSISGEFSSSLSICCCIWTDWKGWTRDAQRLDRKVAFIEIGNKLAAHARGDQPAQDHHRNCSCGQYDRLGGHDTVEQWTILSAWHGPAGTFPSR